MRSQSFSLGSISCRRALVVFGAGRSAGAAALRPLVVPVAVDVAADAGGGGSGLAVLAPHAVGGLGVDETVWVHDWDDVVVVFVFEGDDVGGGGGEEGVGGVFDDLGTSLTFNYPELDLGFLPWW